MWGPEGRLRAPWRLGAFLGVFLLLLVVLGQVVVWTGGAPTAERPLSWQAAIAFAAAALAASAWAMERVEDAPLAALGMPLGPGAAGWFGRGFLVGAGIMAAALALLAAGGWLSWDRAAGGVWGAAGGALEITAILLPVALAEELLFRGYPLQVLAEGAGGAVAIGATALGFAAVHLANPGVDALAVTNLFLAGLVLGVAWWRTYSLWFATGLHLGWNWVMGVGVDLPVSGIALDVPGFDAALRGPELWTGGAFGPEGGLAVTLAALGGLIWLARTRRLSRDPPVLALSPLPERRRPRGSGGGAREGSEEKERRGAPGVAGKGRA